MKIVNSKYSVYTVKSDSTVIEEDIELTDVTRDGRTAAKAFDFYNIKDQDGKQGSRAALMNYESGAVASVHVHTSWELIIILEGGLEWGNQYFGPNSIIRLEPGSSHAPSAPNGCLGVVVWEGELRTENDF